MGTPTQPPPWQRGGARDPLRLPLHKGEGQRKDNVHECHD